MDPEILNAVREGDADRLRQLITESDQPPPEAAKGLLMLASSRGHSAIVSILLQHWANSIDLAEDGQHLLFSAIRRHDADTARILLNSGVPLDHPITHGSCSDGFLPLHMAISLGDATMVRLLLDRGADPNGSFSNSTPLSLATRLRTTDVLQLLLANGADPNGNSDHHLTPLLSAVFADNEDGVRILLDAGADPNTAAFPSMGPLNTATSRGNKEIVRLLLAHGAKTNFTRPRDPAHVPPSEIADMLSESAGTDLHDAAGAGDLDRLRSLIAAGRNLETTNQWKQTALYVAVEADQEEAVRILLDHGAKPNAEMPLRQTALTLAASQGHTGIVELLLTSGADPFHATDWGETPLLRAALKRSQQTIDLLLTAGPKLTAVDAAILGDRQTMNSLLSDGIDTRNEAGMTPLMGAAAGGHPTLAAELLERGADLNASDRHGRTALLWAVRKDAFPVVQLLLGLGASLPEPGSPTLNLLSHPIYRGDTEMLRLLFAHGVDPDSSAEGHRCALQLAVWAGQPDAIRELVSAGASPDGMAHPQNPRSTPLIDAIGRDRLDLVTLLLDLGASLNGDAAHQPPLEAACEQDKKEIVRLLLERGADPNGGGDRFQTPLVIASGKGNEPIVQLLLDAGAQIDTKNPVTSLDWSALNEQPAIFKLLADQLSPEALAPDQIGLNPATKAIMTALATGKRKFIEDLNINMDDLPEWTKSLIQLQDRLHPVTPSTDDEP